MLIGQEESYNNNCFMAFFLENLGGPILVEMVILVLWI